jgi:hypothetical protein
MLAYTIFRAQCHAKIPPGRRRERSIARTLYPSHKFLIGVVRALARYVVSASTTYVIAYILPVQVTYMTAGLWLWIARLIIKDALC